MRRRRRALTRFVALAMLVAAMVGCGDDGDGIEPLTQEQAQRLAGVLYLNTEAGGATFTLTQDHGQGTRLTMQGQVDWAGGAGHATVVGDGDLEPIREVWWNETTIVEFIPALGPFLQQRGIAAELVARSVDNGQPLDRSIGGIMALRSDERDNPQVIAQQEGTGFLGMEEVAGVEAEVLRLGEITRFWIDPSDGRLLRYSTSGPGGTFPVLFDVEEFTDDPIELPPDEAVVRVEEVADLYATIMPAGG